MFAHARTAARISLLVGVGLAGAGCLGSGGTAAPGSHPRAFGPPCHVSPAVRTPVAPIAGATPRVLLAAVLGEIGPAGVRSATTTAPPPGFPGKSWLTFRLRSAARPEYAYAHWAGLLAAVAYRDQARRNHLTEVAGTSFADGSTVLGGRGRRGRATYRTLSTASLACLIRRNAARLHARVVSLRMLNVEGMPVPVVTVSVPPALATRSGGNWGLSYSFLDSSAPPPYVGYWVTVKDDAGRWVQSLGQVPSAGGGSGDISTRYRSGRSCAGLPVCSAHG
jgi:hypothetical protein